MVTLISTLRERAILAVEGYDIDILDWKSDDDITSYSKRVLEAAQSVIADCTPEERAELKRTGKRSRSDYIEVFVSLYRIEATDVDPGATAALIVAMHRASSAE